jgi:hypothetical protein
MFVYSPLLKLPATRQVHSVPHYSLKKYQHPTYALCRSFGLLGKLETAPPLFKTPASRSKLSTKASVSIFVIRALAASWSFCIITLYLFYSFPELIHAIVVDPKFVNYFDIDYLHDIELGWLRRWKQCALVVPYVIVCAFLTADIARASKVQLCIFALVWVAVLGLVGFGLALLPLETNVLAFCGALAPPLLMWVLLATFFYQKQQRPSQPRRIELLYAEYFGVNGSLFPMKVLFLQAATVVLQTSGKLLLLGEIANMKSPLFDGTPGRVVYWTFFTLLGINAIAPAFLLQAESFFWQRTAVCYLDIILDLMYTLVFGVYLFLTLFLGALAPTDALSFGSSLLPLLHIQSVARAIETQCRQQFAENNSVVGPSKDENANTNNAADNKNCDAAVEGGDNTKPNTLKSKAKNERTVEIYESMSKNRALSSTGSMGPVVKALVMSQKTAPISKTLFRKVAAGFLIAQLLTMAFIIASHGSLYPFTSDQCAPCTCPSGVLDCRGIEFSNSLQFLVFEHSQLTALSEGAFEDLGSLQYLSFRHNGISKLPDGIFSSLKTLQELYLYNNSLTVLSPAAFDSLTSLQKLELSFNQLTTLPERAFGELASLRKLLLEGNDISSLPKRAFEGLESLVILSLGVNNITTLSEGTFEGLASLQTLQLRGNHHDLVQRALSGPCVVTIIKCQWK